MRNLSKTERFREIFCLCSVVLRIIVAFSRVLQNFCKMDSTPNGNSEQLLLVCNEQGELISRIDQLGNVSFATNESIQPSDDEKKLIELLTEFEMLHLFPILKNSGITFHSLKYLSKDDIKDSIPSVGLRAEFREKLFFWRKRMNIDADTLSVTSKVDEWIKENNTSHHSSSPAEVNRCSQNNLSKDLKELIKETQKGRALLMFYTLNKNLLENHRRDLITIIVEDFYHSQRKLSPKDFPPLINEIITIFPTETAEYYFIPRRNKKNPGGKLYDKYVNLRSKIRRIVSLSEESSTAAASCDDSSAEHELDENLLISLKSSLARDFSDWSAVKDKWQRTFSFRFRELRKEKTNSKFLKEWPLYTHAKALDLEMASRRKIWNTSSKDDAVLWLWAAHNEVNKRLSGDATEDPEFPKVQFPTKEACPTCVREPSVSPSDIIDMNWDKTEVLQFLKQIHSPQNVSRFGVEDETVLPATMEKLRSKRMISNVFSDIDMRMGIILYVFCVGMMFLAVKLFLRKGYRRKPYSSGMLGKI